MDNLLTLLQSNPIYMGIAGILAIMVLFSFIKKMFKMVLVVLAILVIYIGYMMWQGKEVSMETIQKDLGKATGKLTEKVETLQDDAVNETVRNILDKQ
ncbi:MAG: hypothetical protein ACE5D8_02785 [Fidelibacterota bacterium]